MSAAAETNSLKGIDDLPGPSISNDLYMLLFKGYLNKIHLLQVRIEHNLGFGVDVNI